MRRSACSAVGTVSGTVWTIDPHLIRVPVAKCAQCKRELDLQAVVERAIRDSVTGSLSFPSTGTFAVVANYADDGTLLSLQIMLKP